MMVFSLCNSLSHFFCLPRCHWMPCPFLPRLVGWLVYNGTFNTNRLYCAMSGPVQASGVVRIDPLHFLAGCCKRRLNQALSVLSLSLGFFWCMCCMCCAVNWGLFFFRLLFFMLFACSVTWLFLLGCQYQYKWLTGKARLRSEL